MAGSLSSLVARTKIYIGGSMSQGLVHRPEGLTAADFAGQPWLLIEQPENLGRIATRGVEAEHSMTRSGPPRRPRAKVARAVEDMTLTFTLRADLPGQAALLAAELDGKARAFRIVLPDAPAGGTPSERLFIAVVGSIAESFGGPEDQPRLLVDLWLSGEPVRVHAAEGVSTVIVTVEDLRSHLSLTAGVAEEDAGLLDIYLRGAELLIEAALGYSIHERWPDTQDIPGALQVAVLQLAAFWFEHREAATPRTLTAAPFSVRCVIDAFRDRSF